MSVKKTVFIIGEINVDLIMTGKDVMPQWNQEKLLDSFHMVLGSSSVITATGLAGLGLEVYFVGVVGDDTFGHFCINEMTKKRINTKYIKIDSHIQTGVTLSLSTPQDRALLTYMGSISELEYNDIPDNIFNEADHIHFGSYFLQKGMLPHWRQLFEKSQENNISTSFDTGWDPDEHWDRNNIANLVPYTNIFLPSEIEFKNIFNIKDLDQLMDILPSKHGIIAIKLGSKGSLLIDENGNETFKGGFHTKPIDTTGAGDSFNAGAIYAYLNNYSDKEFLEFSNACGAIAVQRVGGASTVPSLYDVRKFVNKYLNPNFKKGHIT